MNSYAISAEAELRDGDGDTITYKLATDDESALRKIDTRSANNEEDRITKSIF